MRWGENVFDLEGKEKGDELKEFELDVEDEFDKFGEKELEIIKCDKVEKKGSMVFLLVVGVKRIRDEILVELKV